jgi:ketosteroid isomerase-like protein
MSGEIDDFEKFMKRRSEAAGAYTNGDAGPLGRIVARSSPATFFGPRGGHTQGAEDVFSAYARDVEAFAPGGESRFEILQMGAAGDVAYWVGFQRATAKLRGNPNPVPFNLRVTEVFRKEGGEWKMVHRQADMTATERAPGGK